MVVTAAFFRFLRRALVMILTATAALSAPSVFRESSIAVGRGQTNFDPVNLPLVCIEIATVNSDARLISMALQSKATNSELKLDFASIRTVTDPGLLTALHPSDHSSLSLVIIGLNPGRYELSQVIFVPSPGYRTSVRWTFGIGSAEHPVWFEVKAGRVNYVGGVSVTANWAEVASHLSSNVNQRLHEAHFTSQNSITKTMERDAKWACDVDPCMRTLPSVVSPIQID
jgi:hypothetical protein